MADTIKVKYIHSPIGRNKTQKQTVLGLGFRKLNQVRELQNTPSIQGMLKKIPHLVQVID